MCGMQRRTEVAAVIRSLIFFISILGIDQASKYIARTHPSEWTGAFLYLSKNEGIAFSLPLPPSVVWVIVGAALFGIASLGVFFLWRHRTQDVAFLSLVLAGGVSNTIDRAWSGAVQDIFLFPGGLFFNIADCAIVIGLLGFFFRRRSL